MAVSAALCWSVGGGCGGTSPAPALRLLQIIGCAKPAVRHSTAVPASSLNLGWQLIVHRRIASVAGWQAASAGWLVWGHGSFACAAWPAGTFRTQDPLDWLGCGCHHVHPQQPQWRRERCQQHLPHPAQLRLQEAAAHWHTGTLWCCVCCGGRLSRCPLPAQQAAGSVPVCNPQQLPAMVRGVWPMPPALAHLQASRRCPRGHARPSHMQAAMLCFVQQTATARPPQQQEQCQQQQRQRQQCCLGPCGRCSRHMASSCCSIAWQAVCQHPADQACSPAGGRFSVGQQSHPTPISLHCAAHLLGMQPPVGCCCGGAVEGQLLGGCATPTCGVPASSAAPRRLHVAAAAQLPAARSTGQCHVGSVACAVSVCRGVVRGLQLGCAVFAQPSAS